MHGSSTAEYMSGSLNALMDACSATVVRCYIASIPATPETALPCCSPRALYKASLPCTSTCSGPCVHQCYMYHRFSPVLPGRKFLTKINANIGNSAVSSSIEEVGMQALSCREKCWAVAKPHVEVWERFNNTRQPMCL